MFAFPSILLYPLQDGDPDDDCLEPGLYLSVKYQVRSVQCHYFNATSFINNFKVM